MEFRKIIVNIKRVINKFSCYKNRIKLKLYDVRYGKNCIIHGHLGLKLSSEANINIGDNFYLSCGKHINPLAKNLHANICIDKGAMLIIGDNVAMSSPVIWTHNSIKIGNYVKLGANVIIMDSDAHSLNYQHRRSPSMDIQNKIDVPIIIEDDVFIGMNTIIMKGVTIGTRSIIGAGSVVTKSIPADCIAAGNPAKVLRKINSCEDN